MKRTTLLATLAALLAGITAASGANQTISVNFQGRSSDTGNPATPPLAPTDRAGVVAVSNWNNVDDQYGGNGETLDGANNGTSVALNDSTGAATPVTVTFTANDSWYNDVAFDAVTTPNAKMMNGIIKRQGVGTATEFTFNNLTDAQYDLYVYFNMNGDGVRLNLSDNHYVQNFYVVETHEFTDTSTFIECKNTNPNGPYDVGNYVHFKNLATYGGSSLTVLATYISGADGNGIAGMQLINVGPPVAPPPPPAPPPILLTQPVSGRFVVGDTPSFSILPYGSQPAAQWFKNGTAIPDATNNTYRTPPLTAADDQAKFRAVVSNSSGSVTSSVAVVTIGHLVFGPGVKREFYSGHVRADLEDPGFTDPPTSVNYLPSIEAPINVANNFAERLSTLFIPSVTGDYVFFVCSDDDSDLFLSTDDKPANKHLIAQETGWSTSRQWVSSAGASDLDSKRSDKFASTEWPQGNTIHLTSGTRYYIEGVHHEGGGGDNFAATFSIASANEPDPKDGSPPRLSGGLVQTLALDGSIATITRQPADAQIQESRKASFSVAATSQTIGSPDIPAIYYQWQKQAPGASSFTDIAGATSSGYATGKLTAADNNTQFRCVVSVIGFSTNSVAAKLTIVPDTFPPQITGVGSLQKTSGAIEIGIGFDEELDPVSAGTASNYKLSSGMVTGVRFEKYVTEVGAVVLATSGLTPGANTTVTVTGVKDLKGNTMAATQKPVSITSRLKWAAVGGDDYIQAGGSAAIWPDDAVAISDRDFDLVSSGSANWDNYDEITFAYESVTGDFDKVVRVEYQDPTSQWARAGLMARAALDEGVDRATSTGGTYETSQAMFIRVNPTVQWDGTPGNNAWEFVWRDTPGGNCANTGGGGIPLYPNAWIRMQRTGQVFTGYRSDDGQTWINIGTHTFPVDNPLPNALFVGPYYSPELGNNGTKDGIGHSTVARFRDYGNFGLSAPPEITAVTFSGGNVTITWAGGGTLQSTTTLSAPSWNNETGNGTFTAPATGNKYFRVAR